MTTRAIITLASAGLCCALLFPACSVKQIWGDARIDILTDWIPDGAGPCEEYTDSDDDTIPDSIEGTEDQDGDTVPNDMDDDSDADTIPDCIEAGDNDLCTHPVNTDWRRSSEGFPIGDYLPDFLDTDSDNDGLSDADEREMGTDPTNNDTDGDGVTDLGEMAFETNPTDPTSTMDPDDFFVILPYMARDHEYRRLETENSEASPLDISVTTEDEPDDPPGDDYDASVFMKRITPESGYPAAPMGFSSMDETSFYDVVPGTEVTFNIDFFNNTVTPMDTAQAFKAWIAILGDGERPIDRRMVVVIVPVIGMP